MSDEPYSGFKQEQKITTILPSTGGRTRVVVHVRPGRRLRETEDYSAFKATVEAAMESAVEKLKHEMKVQHDITRGTIQASRIDVLGAIKASPGEYLKLMCEFAALFLSFCLAIHYTTKIELVNTAFAWLMLFACAVYWSMARLKQSSERKLANDSH